MGQIVFVGPSEDYSLRTGGRVYVFERGVQQEVPDTLRDYLLERSAPSLEHAANYGEQVWRDPGLSEEAGTDG